MARYWVEAGDEVTVLTGMPNHPTGIIHDGYKGKVRVEEQVDGYQVLRTWLYATPNEGVVKKTLGHLSFMVSSVLLGWQKSGPADVVVVSSPTFFSIFSAYLLAKVKRARFVVDIRDLWPAIFVELGVPTNRYAIAVLEHLELWVYRVADDVVVVSAGFQTNLTGRGVPASEVHVIRNGVDLNRFESGVDPAPGRRRLGTSDDRKLVLYLGAHGISHGLETVTDAAGELRNERIDVVFVGEGAKKETLKQHAQRTGATSVRFFDGVPRSEVPSLLAAADICLVPLRDVPLFSTSSGPRFLSTWPWASPSSAR